MPSVTGKTTEFMNGLSNSPPEQPLGKAENKPQEASA